jgi:hypothetical protein
MVCRAWRMTAVWTITCELCVCWPLAMAQLSPKETVTLQCHNFYHDNILQILLQNMDRTEHQMMHAVSAQLKENEKPSAHTSDSGRARVCVVCSVLGPVVRGTFCVGSCNSSPWLLDMIPAANHI